jgi:hypothetical protein
MTSPDGKPVCPRCGGDAVNLCGQSIEYGPEEHSYQPLAERARQTLAYQCQCGLGFTQTIQGDAGPTLW